jgi:putative ABC transport system permease protein
MGAESRDIRKLIAGEGFRLIASGIAAGLVAAFGLFRVLRTLLFGGDATDPLTLAAVAILFGAFAMLACLGSHDACGGRESCRGAAG